MTTIFIVKINNTPSISIEKTIVNPYFCQFSAAKYNSDRPYRSKAQVKREKEREMAVAKNDSELLVNDDKPHLQ